jgi:hypothetical protein
MYNMRLWNDLYATFSTEKSYLSSKKIERFVSFTSATLIIVIYATLRLSCVACVNGFDTGSVVLLSSTLYGYGAYNSFLLRKEKNDTNENQS